MLKFFENLVDPYPADAPVVPPRGFMAFLWAGTAGLRKYLLGMTLLSALIGVFEAALFGMLGRIVDILATLPRDRLWIEGALPGGRRPTQPALSLLPSAARPSRLFP